MSEQDISFTAPICSWNQLKNNSLNSAIKLTLRAYVVSDTPAPHQTLSVVRYALDRLAALVGEFLSVTSY